MLKVTPRVGALVQTPSGKGTVISVNLLKGKLKVSLSPEKTGGLEDFNVSEVKVLKNAKIAEQEQIDTDILKTLEE